MPLTLTAASVPLALHERVWWLAVAAGAVFAVGRYFGWREAAFTAVMADERALVLAVGNRQRRLPWDDISWVQFQRGVVRPRWTVSDRGGSTLPTLFVERLSRDYHGKRINERLGSLLILHGDCFEAAAAALSAECAARGVRFQIVD